VPRWPWQRHKEPPVTEGTVARIQAERDLEEHKAQRVVVSEVATSLRGLRVRNHFSDRIAVLIEEGPKR
jgi:hypothetical protein